MAYTDKGAGSDYVDLDAGIGVRLDGTPGRIGEAADLAFAPDIPAGASGVAFKHAHSQDNPEAGVHLRDEGSYIHIHTPGRCLLTRHTLSELAGRPVRIGDVEPHMAFFAGHIATTAVRRVNGRGAG